MGNGFVTGSVMQAKCSQQDFPDGVSRVTRPPAAIDAASTGIPNLLCCHTVVGQSQRA